MIQLMLDFIKEMASADVRTIYSLKNKGAQLTPHCERYLQQVLARMVKLFSLAGLPFNRSTNIIPHNLMKLCFVFLASPPKPSQKSI